MTVPSPAGDVRLIYTTFGTLDEAHAVGHGIVEAGLAACVNILPGMTSIYRWQGNVETGAEILAIFKTRAALADAVVAEIKKRHSYTTPAVIVLPVAGGNPDFLAWIEAETHAE